MPSGNVLELIAAPLRAQCDEPHEPRTVPGRGRWDRDCQRPDGSGVGGVVGRLAHFTWHIRLDCWRVVFELPSFVFDVVCGAVSTVARRTRERATGRGRRRRGRRMQK